MSRPDRRYIPDAWPRGMRAEVAAEYVGLSESTFLREVAAGRAPAPVEITAGRRVWLRDQLDGWLERLAGVAVAPAVDLSKALDEWQPSK